MFKLRKIKFNHNGLTLMETTIALGILMIGILSSLSLMSSSFKFSRHSENEIVVVNLAREGLEIVRSMRNNQDDNNPNDFDIFSLNNDTNFILDSRTSNSNAEMTANIVNASSASTCTECLLYFKNGQYVHDSVGGTPTIYRRLIKIEDTASPNERRIISEVSWTVKNKTYTYDLETHLTDWQ